MAELRAMWQNDLKNPKIFTFQNNRERERDTDRQTDRQTEKRAVFNIV